MEGMIADLSQHTEEGYVYRVDMRLRPYGSSGELIPTRMGLIDYYQRKASLWEIQAALKMRPVAGNQALGYHLLEKIEPIILQARDREEILQTIERMRTTAIKAISQKFSPVLDVKSSYGGIRDVEFLVQGLQLIHAPINPGLLHENTLRGLTLLHKGEFIPLEVKIQLEEDYLFLRRVEHYLQILDDQQIHRLPRGKEAMNILARKITSVESSGEKFTGDLRNLLKRVHEAYLTYLFNQTTE
jgi:glutamate-ammonia-ligase adenylyltransferase